MSTPTPTGNASLSSILTAAQNIVVALNAQVQTELNLAGALNAAGISTPTVVSAKAGRLVTVSIIEGGTAPGMIYDSATLGVTTRPLSVIPTLIGVYNAPLPNSFGILVVPGAGQTVTIGYS